MSDEPIKLKDYVAIVATSQKAGKEYAHAVGLDMDETRIITDPRQAQGLRIRALIITPGYFSFIMNGMWGRMGTLDSATHSAVGHNAPAG